MLKYLGYIEITVGIGTAIGPIIGQDVFLKYGYQITQYFFAGTCIIGIFLICILMPGSLNNTVSNKELHILIAETQNDEEISPIKYADELP